MFRFSSSSSKFQNSHCKLQLPLELIMQFSAALVSNHTNSSGTHIAKISEGVMAQIFRRRCNSIARASLLAFVILLCASGWILHAVYWSPYTTREMIPLEQPVPFSHKHHVFGLGIDCRFCHTTVEKSAFAGLPSTETCMTCHSQIWKDAPMLAPVRESLAQNKPLSLESRHGHAGFRFFQPQHPCWSRHRLRDVSWPARSNAAHLAIAHALHEMVSRMSSRPGKIYSSARPGFQSELDSDQSTRAREKTRHGLSRSHRATHRLQHVPPIIIDL